MAHVFLLGTFEASVDGREVALGGPRQRAVLARMLAGGDAPVTADQIVTDVWGEHAAGSTAGTVHAYVSRLRRLLGEAAIPRRGGGYVVDRSVVTVDAERFVEEVTAGRRALGRSADTEAGAVLGTGLARWRGPRAFGGLADVPYLAAEGARLEELRVAAAEMLSDALARQGRAGAEIELLEELALRDPLRESLAVRLVRALYAAGRQADALGAYDRCRRALAEQLGVDPTAELKEAHAAVLAQVAPAAVAPAGAPLPTSLPVRNRAFVGRQELLRGIVRALDEDGRRPRAVVLSGLAGAGKTETALELVHRRRKQGRVAWWIAAENPTGVAASLADLAAAMGITARTNEEDVRAQLWNALDRMPGWIIVFDNVDEPGWLEPFLPTAVHGDVIITSRNSAWRRLARPVHVPAMTREEAMTYIAERSGDPDPDGAAALADLLGDLPLALDQACAYIEQTGMAVHDYVRLFRKHRASLLMREAADGPTVATTWGLAFDRVRNRSPLAATVLETMAFLAADAMSVAMLVPLVGDELDLHDAVGELLRLSLVDRQADVLRVHRLVQDVVRARMAGRLARERLAEATRLCTGPRAAVLTDPAPHLVTLAGHAEALGSVPDGLVAALAHVARHYAQRALYPAAEQILRQALRLVEVGAEGGVEAGADAMPRGTLVCQLGEVLDAAGRLTDALALHEQAVELLTAGGPAVDDAALAHAYNRLGHVLNCADRPMEAIAAHRRAIVILRSAGLPERTASVLVDLGYTLWSVGRLDSASTALQAGRELLEEAGRRDDRTWAHATAGLGMAAQDRGDLDEAVACHRRAITVFTRVCGADHPDTAQAFDKLGYTLHLQGKAAAAVEAHQRAVLLLERVLGANDSRVAMTLTNLGLAYADAGRTADSVEAQSRAYEIFRSALGAEHASTLLACRRWAVALAADGESAFARVVLARVLDTALAKASNNPAERARIEADAALVTGTKMGPEISTDAVAVGPERA